MKPSTSSRPCIDKAASWSAAIQPSVRSSSAATWLESRSRSGRLTEIRRSLVTREAQVRGSNLDELTLSPQTRQRERWIGACRDHDVRGWRQVLEQEATPGPGLAGIDHVEVIKHQHDVGSDAASSLARVVTTISIGGGWAPAPSRGSAPAAARHDGTRWLRLPRRRRTRCRPGRGTPTTGIRSSGAEAASQSASNVVLPNPGGAEMSVTFARALDPVAHEAEARATEDSRGRGT